MGGMISISADNVDRLRAGGSIQINGSKMQMIKECSYCKGTLRQLVTEDCRSYSRDFLISHYYATLDAFDVPSSAEQEKVKITEVTVDLLIKGDKVFCASESVIEALEGSGKVEIVTLRYGSGNLHKQNRATLISSYYVMMPISEMMRRNKVANWPGNTRPLPDFRCRDNPSVLQQSIEYRKYVMGDWEKIKEEKMDIKVSKLANGLILEVEGYSEEVGTFIASTVKEAEVLFGKLITEQLYKEEKPVVEVKKQKKTLLG